jgi:hypothetical protein
MRNRRALSLLAVSLSLATAGGEQPSFVVHGPTIVAFFPLVKPTELANDADTNEALADFQEYANRVREPLRNAGIDFHEIYALTFRIHMGAKSTTFRPGNVTTGYYFVAPGKKPRVQYGVATDVDLLQIAHDYFGLAAK